MLRESKISTYSSAWHTWPFELKSSWHISSSITALWERSDCGFNFQSAQGNYSLKINHLKNMHTGGRDYPVSSLCTEMCPDSPTRGAAQWGLCWNQWSPSCLKAQPHSGELLLLIPGWIPLLGSHLGCPYLLLMAVAGHERSNIPSSVLPALTSVPQLPLIPAAAQTAGTAFPIRVLHSQGGMLTGGTAVFERLSKKPTRAWSGRGSREHN